MTRNKYNKSHLGVGKHMSDVFCDTPPDYVPKHSLKWYTVWRVLSHGGPAEEIPVLGLDMAKQLIAGCYDSEVTDVTGKVIL